MQERNISYVNDNRQLTQDPGSPRFLLPHLRCELNLPQLASTVQNPTLLLSYLCLGEYCLFSHPGGWYWGCIQCVNTQDLQITKFFFIESTWRKKHEKLVRKFYIKPLAASSAIWRRTSQSKRFWSAVPVRKSCHGSWSFMSTNQGDGKKTFEITGRRVDHVCDPSRFHCACTHTPEYVDVLLHNIQLKEPNSCDESLTKGQPASAFLLLMQSSLS